MYRLPNRQKFASETVNVLDCTKYDQIWVYMKKLGADVFYGFSTLMYFKVIYLD
jgi:hypothetical protein